MEALNSDSKVLKVQHHIRRMIRRGELKAGQRLPPERQFSEMLDVSRLTLNKAMAGLQAERVLDRTQGRGTFVRQDVRRGTVAVVYPSGLMGNPQVSRMWRVLFEELVYAFQDASITCHSVLASDRDERQHRLTLELESPFWDRVDVALTAVQTISLSSDFAWRGIEAVSLGADSSSRYAVEPHNAGMAEMATRHLVSRGYRQIGLITHEPLARGLVSEPFRQALLRWHMKLRTSFCAYGVQRPNGGYEAMRELWSRAQRPDAIFITDDILSAGVGQAVLDLGIVSHANIGVDMGVPIRMTLCGFPLKRMVRALFGLADRVLRKGRIPPTIALLRAQLVQGDTT